MSNFPRFYFSDAEFAKGKYYLHDAEIIRHARKVLRLAKGDKIELFDGKGTVYITEIDLLSKDLLIVTLLEEKTVEERGGVKISLAQGLPKLGKVDDILRMNTEIGVEEFVLFESDHSVVKIKDYHEGKLLRLNKIVREAARQSHNDFLPTILGPVDFESVLKKPADVKVLLHPSESDQTSQLSEVKKLLKGDERITICIGPEGGFSPREIESAKSNGFQVVNLDLPILRTETAGLVVASFLLI